MKVQLAPSSLLRTALKFQGFFLLLFIFVAWYDNPKPKGWATHSLPIDYKWREIIASFFNMVARYTFRRLHRCSSRYRSLDHIQKNIERGFSYFLQRYFTPRSMRVLCFASSLRSVVGFIMFRAPRKFLEWKLNSKRGTVRERSRFIFSGRKPRKCSFKFRALLSIQQQRTYSVHFGSNFNEV